MDSSRTRNSILDWPLAATLAIAVLVFTAGIDFRMAGVTVRSHSAVRVLAAAAAIFLVRRRFGIPSYPAWLQRIVLITAICGSVATWFRFLLTTIGGADSYGYVSASDAIAGGHLIADAPIAGWLSASNRLAVASPLGWTPAPDEAGISPTFPIGVSTLMALFTMVGGSNAVFFVAPVTGMITLWLVYRLTREWFDAETALFATAIVAWNPVTITYAKQPMSDMAATMWIVMALLLAVRASNLSAFCSGLAAGAAVITRPALIVAGAIVPLTAHRGESPRQRVVMSGAGFGIGVLVQMAIQNHLFGSPMASGYGTAGTILATTYFTTNAGIFARHAWSVVGPLWIPGVFIGLIAADPERRWKPAAVFGGVLLPYLFWLPFDHWETLRFLLPGLVPLTIVAAHGLMHLARLPRKPVVEAVVIAAFMAIIAGRSETLLRHSSVWDVASLEARYPLAGEWIDVNTPGGSVVLANQHSGSLRWYGKRQTLRWDFVAPEQLATTIRELQEHGATAYVALEGDEAAMFDGRFAGAIEQLQVDHVGRVRNVSFRRLVYLPPNK